MRPLPLLVLVAACTSSPSSPPAPKAGDVPGRLAVAHRVALPPAPAPSPRPRPSAAERAATRLRGVALLPPPSAHMAKLLVAPRLPAPPPPHPRPDPVLDWIVDLPVAAEGAAARAAAAAGSLRRYGATLWGQAPDGRWRAVAADDAPRYQAFAVAVPLVVLVREEDVRVTQLLAMQSLLDELRVHPLLGAAPQPRTTPEIGAAYAQTVAKLENAGDIGVSLLLVAPPGQPFEARAVWDVLTSLGLTFADGDVFQWPLGDSAGFTVDTTTPPGYFDPVAVAAGRWHVGELRFETRLWQARAPLAAYDALERAFSYAQKRLGGRRAGNLISGDDHDPLVPAAARLRLQSVTATLTGAGIVPGSFEARRLFTPGGL